MAGITLAQAEAKLSAALGAVDAAMVMQSYGRGGRNYTRADLDSLQAQVEFWDRKVKQLSGTGGIRITGATPT